MNLPACFPDTKTFVMNRPAGFDSALVREIRNPLSNINLSIDMLKSIGKDEDAGIYLDIIMRSSLRITSLINELLSYQQAEA